MNEIKKITWQDIEKEQLSKATSRQMVNGEKATLARFVAKGGITVPRHSHPNEEYLMVSSGAARIIFDDREVELNPSEVLVIPSNVPHAIAILQDTEFIDFFSPVREDWLRGEDQYLRTDFK